VPIAAIYDIHANAPALEAVLEEIRCSDVDGVVIGGDVLPGPFPRECIEQLLELEIPTRFLRGNGDREVLAQMSGIGSDWYQRAPENQREPIRWCAQQLQTEQQRLLESWPATLRINIPSLGEVLFCHATPRSDTEIFTRSTPDECLLPIFGPHGVSMVVCGHTHMQFDRQIGSTRVINAGSVGMPFGKPGADWLMLGPTVQLRHTDYDLGKASCRIIDSTYPQAREFAARSVLQPPSEEEVMPVLTRAEVR
jgi:predicted phosphodiesterase